MGGTAKTGNNAWLDRHIVSVADVFEALEYLTLPRPSNEIIELIGTGAEKGKFKDALEACLRVDGKEPDKETKRYVVGLINSVSNTTIQAVSSLLGYEKVPLEAFVIVGQEKGTTFYNAVRAAIAPNDPAHANGKTVVEELLQYAVDKAGGKLVKTTPQTGQSAKVKQAPPEASPPTSSHDEQAIQNTEEDAGNGYYSTHAYGGGAALCFNATKTTKNHFSVIVDAALSIGERKYDWSKAIKIQLSHKELPILYGVLVGWHNSAKFDAHGPANDKSFHIERQEGKLYAKVIAKSEKQRAVPIGPMDILPIMNLVLSQIIKESPTEIRNHPNIIIGQMRAAQNIKSVPSTT